MKKRLLSYIIALSIVLSLVSAMPAAAASTFTEGDWVYSAGVVDAIINGYTGAGGAVIIPPTLGGVPVSCFSSSSIAISTIAKALYGVVSVFSGAKTIFEGFGTAFSISPLMSITNAVPCHALNVGINKALVFPEPDPPKTAVMPSFVSGEQTKRKPFLPKMIPEAFFENLAFNPDCF